MKRGLTHRWLEPADADASSDGHGSGVEPLVARVLRSRGVDAAGAAAFCAPKLSGMHDPSLLSGLDAAAERLVSALGAGEPVVIYGDYDVDGVCASAILFHVMRTIAPGAPVSCYVPHRLDEGYGLHVEAIGQLASGGTRVIVSVDCGVTAFEAARAARAVGVDLIITDHHHLPEGRDGLPDALAIVHPRLPGSAYPFGDLCGAAVAFKLAWRLATLAAGSGRVGEPMRTVLLDLLALAGLGTIADVVPLVGENRIIARCGLARLKSTGLTGLRELIEASGLSGENIGAEQVGFTLGPRLNACGRMGHAKEAVELLTTAPPARAREIARSLAGLNDERKRTERAIFEAARRMAEERGMTGGDRRAIVLASAEWHAGVVGIVCSRLIGAFHRPTILLQRGADGACHGSGRSIDGFDLHAALAACGGHLERFGGHEMAAGLGLHESKLEGFTEAFIAHANARLDEDHLIPSLRIDCRAELGELSSQAVEQLGALGPFGRGNPSPRVLLEDLRMARRAEPFGAGGAHLSVYVRAAHGAGREMRLIGWRWGEQRGRLAVGSRLDAVVEPKLNTWNGSVRIEPEIADLRVG